ncbi:MAG: rhomboid family intramembrane serine protease [Gemmatimonadota bacterium]
MGGMTPWVRRLLIANAVIFFAQQTTPLVLHQGALVPALLLARPWTVVSYMFLHGGLMHLALNMLILYFFGPRLEHRLGAGHFLGLYFVSGIAAAMFSFFTPAATIVGASGAIYGIMLAYADYWPRDRLYLYFVIPVEARWVVLGLTGLAIYGIVQTSMGVSDGIAHHAHLGGFAGAWLYLRIMGHTSPAARFKREASPAPKRRWASDREAIKRWRGIDRDALHPVNREAFDEIMEKLATEGIGRLTDRERAFLDRFAETIVVMPDGGNDGADVRDG